MKAVNVNDVLRILYNYGQFIPVTDVKKYRKMMDEIANLPSTVDTIFSEIKKEIEQVAKEESKYDMRWTQGLRYALKIINECESESED